MVSLGLFLFSFMQDAKVLGNRKYYNILARNTSLGNGVRFKTSRHQPSKAIHQPHLV